ncbi:hypothetical protein ACFWAY_34125 [Rhodococcus sp. NPDC059968]|uniref:hypothetical protein n=1 Tax=Rhodococcus sp. NPDC059968 TaxID=3347017 RepID=UPI00366E8994
MAWDRVVGGIGCSVLFSLTVSGYAAVRILASVPCSPLLRLIGITLGPNDNGESVKGETQ